MELAELQKHWEAFGERDPLWAILSLTGKRYGGWNPEEFFNVGKAQIAGMMKDLAELRIKVKPGKALDFGCGVGRLSQALADHFEECSGVDISPSMIEHARRYNRHGDRCRYFVNDRNDLSLFEDNTFDLIYSIIVLQHMQPRYALNYIQEFLRVLAPGGLAIFQVPSSVVPLEQNQARPHQSTVTTPLPPSAFQAKITAVERPSVVKAGTQLELHARVKNLSDVVWPTLGAANCQFQLLLGNHWLDANHAVVVQDDGRAGLHYDLAPGEEFDFWLNVNVPQQAGHYHLELDMVQEGVSWFKAHGSDTEILPVEVQASQGANDSFVPQMQMYCVKQEDVMDLINRQGCTVLEVQRVNPEGCYLDYNYYVRKPQNI